MNKTDDKQLTDMQRAFVVSYVRNGGKGKAAAIEAGYSENSADVQACQMLKQRPIRDALRNELFDYAERAAPVAIRALTRIVTDPDATNNEVIKASVALLDRGGVPKATRQDLNVTTQHGDVASIIQELGEKRAARAEADRLERSTDDPAAGAAII
jgi:phage terminase small subunit